jgi:peptide-methionine (S)-S-oxide reductase
MSIERATFAAGCFWGTEHFFLRRFKTSIVSRSVGFMGGTGEENPGYKLVKAGGTGHAEVLTLEFKTAEVTYEALVRFFFTMHNPTELNHQGHDVGSQYRTAIFFHDSAQKATAEKVLAELASDEAVKAKLVAAYGGGRQVVTTLEPAAIFFPAEDYHQNYLEINPDGECNHRSYWAW